MIQKTLRGENLPVYGDGSNIRDWLYVGDHCRGLAMAAAAGVPGETYVIGGKCEMKNIDVVRALIETVRELAPDAGIKSPDELITFVTDRPGHDRRYAIDPTRITKELGWEPMETFRTGLRKTVQWYLDHADWIESIEDGSYRGQRLGTLA
jgi:dTDP-glucose 4,6-dehydratase